MAITALIPAGGLGSRLLPLTRAVPKALLPVGAVPAIEYGIAELAAAGVSRAVVLTSSPVSEAVQRYFAGGDPPPLDVEVVHLPWTLGMREVLAYARRELAAARFVVLLPDEILPGPPETLRALLATSTRYATSAAAVIGDVPPLFRFSEVREPAGDSPDGGPQPVGPRMIGRFVLCSDVLTTAEELTAQDAGPLTLPALLHRHAMRSAMVGVRCTQPHWDIGTVSGYLHTVQQVARG